ncbi:hypothetical protein PF438_14850 [Elizabethkingia meningoseptica]|uniref:hypothetical protein n=1 Tax=Elizabethkingia meningoseptica TaxID=238 RepID=UPI0022F17F39|nr:hypothetical protein [Elizabethkingia meningoseptica]EJK5328066.1 hypothetical protein [Elizabethkingia meningoseptica]WBS74171.1 hypothetical protein PF438_14850 [Elizabethkingia meningoseptica]
MRISFYLLLLFVMISIRGQVGINTKNPEATLDVVGKPNDITHYDGIIPPRVTGDELASKTYSLSKKGAVVFVTIPAKKLSGQVINILEPGLYYFDGNLWQSISKQKQAIEYQIVLTFDYNSEIGLTETSGWSELGGQWGNSNNYLTFSKSYTVGTKKFGALKGSITFRKLEGNINVKFEVSREPDSTPVSEDTAIDISDICIDMGYFPRVVVFMVPDNSTFVVPVLIQNNSIYFPAVNLNMISSKIVGEIEGYSNLKQPQSL